jgi:hypothetical protein
VSLPRKLESTNTFIVLWETNLRQEVLVTTSWLITSKFMAVIQAKDQQHMLRSANCDSTDCD